MQNQFSRSELLIGKEGIEKLHKSRVAIFGIGGVGGYTVDALVRSGVEQIDLIDDDKVCLTNLNRQLIATRKTLYYLHDDRWFLPLFHHESPNEADSAPVQKTALSFATLHHSQCW